MTPPQTLGTGNSVVVDRCQICQDPNLESVVFMGYLPPVNTMYPIDSRPQEQVAYPAELLRCPTCQLHQLGLIVDAEILFPPTYPYTTGTTRILRDNFAHLYRECSARLKLTDQDLIVDIGANDGTLLANFQEAGHPVLAVEPTERGELAAARGIPTVREFFTRASGEALAAEHGRAAVITATNVFAHIEDVNGVVEGVLAFLRDDGSFITESHYLRSLVETLQYDTIYHEHLRYYSLASLDHLFRTHGLEIYQAVKIPTHGGSIRVYAARTGTHAVAPEVDRLRVAEVDGLSPESLEAFRGRMTRSKLALHALFREIIADGGRIHGIGAPSRASTLINFLGIDEAIMPYVMEIKGSYKIGNYMPGTRIPVMNEALLYEEQPEYALMLSWHIADELMPKIAGYGFNGDFIVPLPEPRIVRNADIEG